MDDEACHIYDTALCLMLFCVQVLEPTDMLHLCVYMNVVAALLI